MINLAAHCGGLCPHHDPACERQQVQALQHLLQADCDGVDRCWIHHPPHYPLLVQRETIGTFWGRHSLAAAQRCGHLPLHVHQNQSEECYLNQHFF